MGGWYGEANCGRGGAVLATDVGCLGGGGEGEGGEEQEEENVANGDLGESRSWEFKGILELIDHYYRVAVSRGVLFLLRSWWLIHYY